MFVYVINIVVLGLFFFFTNTYFLLENLRVATTISVSYTLMDCLIQNQIQNNYLISNIMTLLWTHCGIISTVMYAAEPSCKCNSTKTIEAGSSIFAQYQLSMKSETNYFQLFLTSELPSLSMLLHLISTFGFNSVCLYIM